MYEFTSRVRYSEIGPDYNMKLSSLAARMQDCCVFHSSAVGRGPDVWIRENCAWLILSWQIRIHRVPRFEMPITTRTWAYSFRGFEGMRNFTVRDEEGELLADANSRWVYFDLGTQLPVRVPEEEITAFMIEPKLEEFDYAPRRIRLPKTEEICHPSFDVVPTNIDTNRHVNNLQYIDMALAYLPEGFSVTELRVDYIRQSKLGDRLTPKTREDENSYYVSIVGGDGNPCAVLQFMRDGWNRGQDS